MRIRYKNIIILAISPALMLTAAASLRAAVIPADDVRTAIIGYLEEIASESGLEIEVEVPRLKDIEIKNLDDPVMNIDMPSGKKIRARVPVRIVFSDSTGKPVRRVQVSARVKIFKTVAVVQADMKRGEPINGEKIVMERIDISGLKSFFEDSSCLSGMQTNRLLRAGTVFCEKNMCPIPVVRRGSRVRIVVQVGTVSATAEGTARQDGGKDDIIRVYNEMTRTTLECRVIDDKTVETVL